MNVISADVLKIPIYGKPITVTAIKQAMESVSQKQLDDWDVDNVYENRYGVIRRHKREVNQAA